MESLEVPWNSQGRGGLRQRRGDVRGTGRLTGGAGEEPHTDLPRGTESSGQLKTKTRC